MAKKAKKKSAKKPAKKAAKKKSVKKKAAKRVPARKAKKPAKKKKSPARKAPAKKAKPAPKKKKKQIVGEGDYQASRTFLKDQSSFVKANKAKIPALGADAEKALDGPEGDALRAAEAQAAGRSRDSF